MQSLTDRRYYGVDGSQKGHRGILQCDRHSNDGEETGMECCGRLFSFHSGNCDLPVRAATAQGGKYDYVTKQVDALIHER